MSPQDNILRFIMVAGIYIPRMARVALKLVRGCMDNTKRHPTSRREEYGEVRSLIAQHVPSAE